MVQNHILTSSSRWGYIKSHEKLDANCLGSKMKEKYDQQKKVVRDSQWTRVFV